MSVAAMTFTVQPASAQVALPTAEEIDARCAALAGASTKTQLEDDGDFGGGALAVLLLAVGGAVAGVLYAALHDNDLNFGGSVVVVGPVTSTTAAPTTTTAAPTTTTVAPTTTTSSTTTTSTTAPQADPPATSSTTTSTSTTSPSTTSTTDTTTVTYTGTGSKRVATKAIDWGQPIALPAVMFEPGETVEVTLGSVTLATARADSQGKVEIEMCVPSTVAPGENVLEARGATSGTGVKVALTVGAAQAPAPPALPRTGTSGSSLAALALALLAIGLLLTASSRRLARR